MRTLEVCVESPDGLDAAITGGADRIELCSALALGGLTPGPGLMHLAAAAPIPVFALIRPRPGGFVFSSSDMAAMRADIRAARNAGLAGVVLGASKPDGTLDNKQLAELVAESTDLGLTLHRAFDLTPDPFAALECAIALGFQRILTSGQAETSLKGARLIEALHHRTTGRIAIMAGGGITAENAAEVICLTGVNELHSSCTSPSPPAAKDDPAFSFIATTGRQTDTDRVRRLKAVLADVE